MDKRFEAPKPVSVGDLIEVSVESQGGQGDGIAKVDGFIVFVKGGRRGEICKVKIIEVKRTFAIGEKAGPADRKESLQEMDDETEGDRGDGPAG